MSLDSSCGGPDRFAEIGQFETLDRSMTITSALGRCDRQALAQFEYLSEERQRIYSDAIAWRSASCRADGGIPTH
jgi:hypothetical protein